ncbi:MAG: histone deacetylase family protein [Hydrotalea sp.]|nr:histone deacetylase family protein [Hydrotalea sp.]
MKVIYSDKHKLRDAQYEIAGGRLVYPFERPARMEYILARLKERKFNDIIPPKDFGMAPVKKIHNADLLDFLEHGYDEWKAAGYAGDMCATAWFARRMPSDRRPQSIDGKLSYHALSSETMIDKGTWEASLASKDVALTGAEMILKGPDKVVYSLCRPPGHHATADMFGGYCFLNNAAIAAQYMRDNGAKKVAILDVDVHHGNGIQDIFYNRGDVLYVSLHGAPEVTYPFFMGYADETGAGDGVGANKNYPIPAGGKYDIWGAALMDGLKAIQQFGAEILIVSLGTDTYEKDPISPLKLTSNDFITMGRAIAGINLPTHVVMEGGYAVEEIGINAVNFLEGMLDKK